MLYSERFERSHRFKLALRIGVPSLLFFVTLIIIVAIENYYLKDTQAHIKDIYVVVFGLFAVIYYIFLMIYEAFDSSTIDPLTHLFNRHSFLDYCDNPKNSVQAIGLISLRNISDINENYGVDKGDAVLQRLALYLDEFLQSDYHLNVALGRYLGSEVLVGFASEKKEAKEILNKFLTLYNHQKISDVEVDLVASMQNRGTNRTNKVIVNLYDEYFSTRHTQRKSLVNEIKDKKANNIEYFEQRVLQAIDKHQLMLLFTPILEVSSKKVKLVEIQFKLKDEKGIIHPKDFIPIVNRLGYERTYDTLLIKSVIQVLGELDTALKYSFNISPFSLRNELFKQNVIELLRGHAVTKQLIFELFENRTYANIEQYLNVINAFKAIGIEFALDNFGAKNASEEYVKHLPVDYVYFDREFTKRLHSANYRSILQGWRVSLGAMRVRSIMKFIDNEATLKELKSLEIDYAQGFIVSKSMSLERFKHYVHQHSLKNPKETS